MVQCFLLHLVLLVFLVVRMVLNLQVVPVDLAVPASQVDHYFLAALVVQKALEIPLVR